MIRYDKTGRTIRTGDRVEDVNYGLGTVTILPEDEVGLVGVSFDRFGFMWTKQEEAVRFLRIVPEREPEVFDSSLIDWLVKR